MSQQKGQMKRSVQEYFLGKKSPIHCPLEEKLTAKVKRSDDIANWVNVEERQAKEKLKHRANYSVSVERL